MVNTWDDLTRWDIPELVPKLIAKELLCPCKDPEQPRLKTGSVCNECGGRNFAAKYDPVGNVDHFQLALATFRSRILQVRLRISTLLGP